MDDFTHCPICNNKLRTHHLTNWTQFYLPKTADYIERICSHGFNHSLLIATDPISLQIDFMKLSLNPSFSRFIEIDFINSKCRVRIYQENDPDLIINIPSLLMPDFPSLALLNQKVSLYLTFS